ARACSRVPEGRRQATAVATSRCLAFARLEPVVDVIHELAGGRARSEQPPGAASLERIHVLARNDTTAGHEYVVASVSAQQIEYARNERHVRAAQNGKPDDVDVLLNRGGRDHLGSLMQAGVDDLHPRVAQSGRNYFGATVVAVQSRFGD